MTNKQLAKILRDTGNSLFDRTYDPDYKLLLDEAADRLEGQGVWISVDERLPTETENDRGLVGIVNGYNGKIHFRNAIVLVDYDFSEKEWWSEDYDRTVCSIEYWTPLPEAPKKKGGK